MFRKWILLILIPLFILGQVTTSKYLFPLRSKTTGQLVSGKNVDLYQNGTKVYDLTETSPGIYSHDAVASGNYDYYVNGNPLSGYQDKFIGAKKLATIEGHADADGKLGSSGIQADAVGLSQLSPTVRSQLGGSGVSKYAPNDKWTEIEVVGLDTMITVKPDSVDAHAEAKAKEVVNDSLTVTIAGKNVNVREHVKNNNIVNPKDYGAVGDGTTNDYAAIVNMLSSISSDATINLANKIYLLNSTLTISSKSNIKFKNGAFKNGVTTYMMQVASCSDVEFENVEFDGNSQGMRLVYIYTSSNVSFTKCYFHDLGSSGTNNVAGIYWKTTDGVIIKKCRFIDIESASSSSARGVYLADTGTPSKFGKIIECHFENITPYNDGDGIYISATSSPYNVHMQIEGNTFKNVAKRYMKIDAEGVTITGNKGYADNLSQTMLACISSFRGNNTILNNEFFFTGTTNTSNGVVVGSTLNPVVENIKIAFNIFKNSSAPSSSIGIALNRSGNNIKIKNNTFDSFDYGIRDSYSTPPTISDLLIEDNDYDNITTSNVYKNGTWSDFKIENGSTLNIDDRGLELSANAYNKNQLILKGYYIWVDGSGDLRIKSGVPSSDTDGTIIGTQN